MTAKLQKVTKVVTCVLGIVIFGVLLALLLVWITIPGVLKSNIYFYLAAGNSVEGIYLSGSRYEDGYMISIDTEEYGIVSTKVDASTYKLLQPNSSVILSSNLVVNVKEN